MLRIAIGFIFGLLLLSPALAYTTDLRRLKRNTCYVSVFKSTH